MSELEEHNDPAGSAAPVGDWLDLNPDPAHVRREREKARRLRATDWWRAKLQRGVCHYCGRRVGAAALTMDHVVPVARGGTSTKGNCVPCCKECNNRKRAYTPAELILNRLAAETDTTEE